jgi:hypothetical protein
MGKRKTYKKKSTALKAARKSGRKVYKVKGGYRTARVKRRKR